MPRQYTPRVALTCAHCGAAFTLKPSAIRKGQGTYCSRACQYAGQRQRSDAPCPQCGQSIQRRGTASKFCSRACYVAARTVPLAVRFWAKVQKSAGCWTWTANHLPKGYGVIGVGAADQGLKLAHRVSWEIHFGPIPAGLFVCHRCDNPPCVRPDHLFLGTVQDNVDDMVAKGRANYRGGR
jgi:hypothetical protein